MFKGGSDKEVNNGIFINVKHQIKAVEATINLFSNVNVEDRKTVFISKWDQSSSKQLETKIAKYFNLLGGFWWTRRGKIQLQEGLDFPPFILLTHAKLRNFSKTRILEKQTSWNMTTLEWGGLAAKDLCQACNWFH